jgi:hypothetical protein
MSFRVLSIVHIGPHITLTTFRQRDVYIAERLLYQALKEVTYTICPSEGVKIAG